MGSDAYGVSGATSDVDVYGFCVPPKYIVFPHTAGEIPGFGRRQAVFNEWQQHHVDPGDGRDTQYDFTIFGIVRLFHLAMECNPNIIDCLFTPRRCVMYSTQVGEHVRDNRKLFLHKGAWHRFRGYAYSQMHKIKSKTNHSNPSRAESIAKHGYDVKFAYHVVRLLGEVEQIMVEHDLNLELNREQLKAIRRGEWPLDQLESFFQQKEQHLEGVYAQSTLQSYPDEDAIKAVLLQCLEMHFGSLSDAIQANPSIERLVNELQAVLAPYVR